MPNESDIKTEFATTVRLWRRQLGLSQEQLAERAGLHRTYISDVERGARNLSLGSINKLACALDISVSALFPPSDSQINQRGSLLPRECVDVLLVEDDPNDVELTLLAFKKARLMNLVHVVRDGVEAVEFIFCEGQHAGRRIESGPRVILMDLKLPKIDGMDVLRRIKADPRTRTIPVVVLTSSREQKDVVESYRLGVNSYIVKPVNFESFARAVEELGMYWLLLNQPPKLEA